MASYIKPTRQEFLRLSQKLKIADKGHRLLKDKRDGLIKSFLGIVKEVLELRKEVDAQIIQAIEFFNLAQSRTSAELLYEISKNSKATVLIQYEKRNIMGVTIPRITSEVKGDPFCYGILDTTKDLDESLLLLTKVLPQLIRVAELEYAARKLAEEIEKTRRRVNGLEYVIIPQIKKDIRLIRAKLEETARQEKVTLLKIKEKVT